MTEHTHTPVSKFLALVGIVLVVAGMSAVAGGLVLVISSTMEPLGAAPLVLVRLGAAGLFAGAGCLMLVRTLQERAAGDDDPGPVPADTLDDEHL